MIFCLEKIFGNVTFLNTMKVMTKQQMNVTNTKFAQKVKIHTPNVKIVNALKIKKVGFIIWDAH